MLIKVITFAEFLEIAEKNTSLIFPHDEDVRDRNELGIINGRHWAPIEFSEKSAQRLKENK